MMCSIIVQGIGVAGLYTIGVSCDIVLTLLGDSAGVAVRYHPAFNSLGKPPVPPARIAPDGAAHESLDSATSESPGTRPSTFSRASGGSLSLKNSSTLGRNAWS